MTYAYMSHMERMERMEHMSHVRITTQRKRKIANGGIPIRVL